MIREYKQIRSPIDFNESYDSIFIYAKEFGSNFDFLLRSRVVNLKISSASTAQLIKIFRVSQLICLDIINTKADSLSGIEQLNQLQSLRIHHAPKICNLSPLSQLVSLKSLEIETSPSWDASGKKLVVESFEPLSSLQSLEELTLVGIAAHSGSLRPLARLTSLKHLRISNDFLIAEFAYLSRELVNTEGDCLKPVAPGVDNCKKCGSAKVMLIGRAGERRQMFVCEKCNETLVAKHVAEFQAACMTE